jgi:hypothetical protein
MTYYTPKAKVTHYTYDVHKDSKDGIKPQKAAKLCTEQFIVSVNT